MLSVAVIDVFRSYPGMALLIFILNYLVLFHTSITMGYSTAQGYRVGLAGTQGRRSHIWFPSFTLGSLYLREGLMTWAALCWSERFILNLVFHGHS